MSAARYIWDGYGGSIGPMSIPVDTRVITGSRVVRGYGGTGAMGGAYGAGVGDNAQQEMAAAWGGAETVPSPWTGIAVGLTVWMLTKLLDRMFFSEEP